MSDRMFTMAACRPNVILSKRDFKKRKKKILTKSFKKKCQCKCQQTFVSVLFGTWPQDSHGSLAFPLWIGPGEQNI